MAVFFEYEFLPSGLIENDLSIISQAFDQAFPQLNQSQQLVDLGFVSLGEMRALNNEHRAINQPTDVLSFPTIQEGLSFFDTYTSDNPLLIGSIIISPEKAVLYSETIAELVVHSLLHLFGFDHETNLPEWLQAELLAIQACKQLHLPIRGIIELT